MANERIDIDFPDNSKVEYRRLILKFLRNWYWFAISLVGIFSLTLIYLRYSTPVYSINGTLLIKEDKNGQTGSDILNQLNLLGSNNNVKNEIRILSSRSLMDSVVKKLNLTTSYLSIGNIKTGELYNQSPVEIYPEYLKNSAYKEIDLIIKNENKNSYALSDKFGNGHYNYGQTIIRPYGVFIITKTLNFNSTQWDQIKIVFSKTNNATDRYLAALKVTQADEEANVVDLSILEPIPQKGIDIINTLMFYYQKAAITDKNEIEKQTVNFIDEQLKYISLDLSNTENNIEQYEQKNGISNVNAETGIVLNNISEYDKQLSDLEIKDSILQFISGYLTDLNKQDSLVPSTLGINDPTLLELIANFNRVQLQKERFTKSTGPGNPLIIQLNDQLSNLKNSIIEDIKNLQNGISLAIQNIRSQNSSYSEQIKAIPLKERELVEITRQKEIKENLYIYLLQKREEASLSLASAISNSRIIDPAYASPLPVKPVRILFYLIAVLLGMVIPGSVIYIKDIFNTKISSEKDIQDLTDISILGSISKNYSDDEIVIKEKSRSAISEQFRLIRTNLEFLIANKTKTRSTKIMITSSMSGEGKSFFTLNLGLGLAISNKRTILLEVDLRKPKLSDKLGESNLNGLSNYISGKLNIEEIIKPTKFNENLFLISSGPLPPNPSELLLNEKVHDLFKYLESNFDFIVLDTAPIGIVADALILSKFVDLTLYIVRHNYTYKHQVKMVDQFNKESKLKNIALIFNSVKWDSRSYGYGYGNKYGYYE